MVQSLSAQTSPLPDEPIKTGEVLVAGRLPWGPTALPTGEILAADENKTVTVLDAQAKVLAKWQAPDRFSAALTAAPVGPLNLAAVPLLSGQIMVLAWDTRTSSLVPSFVPARKSEATATAWTASGDLVAGWKDGQVEIWRNRARSWSTASGVEARFLLVDNSQGVYVFGPGRAALLDFAGQVLSSWTLNGTPRGVLQSLGGAVVCWTEKGLWGLGEKAFVPIGPPADVLGTVIDGQSRLVVTEPDRIRRLRFDGSLVDQLSLPRRAQTPAVVDDRGRYLVGTVAGLEEWAYDGRLIARLSDSQPTAVLLTETGVGAWGTADWKVHVWSGFRWPAYGWPLEGGNSGRSYASQRPAGIQTRATRWTEEPAFTYLYLLASSGREEDQREALDRIEAAGAQGSALWQAPWLDIVLLKIARSGLTDLQMSRGQVSNSWPLLRLRAFLLLSRTAGPDDRDELLDLVGKEYDTVVLAAAVKAMTRSSWDGDGKLMRMLNQTLSRANGDPGLADTILDAARVLWQRNGRSTDPVLVPLVQSVFQGPYPTSVKLKAQKFFQDLLLAP